MLNYALYRVAREKFAEITKLGKSDDFPGKFAEEALRFLKEAEALFERYGIPETEAISIAAKKLETYRPEEKEVMKRELRKKTDRYATELLDEVYKRFHVSAAHDEKKFEEARDLLRQLAARLPEFGDEGAALSRSKDVTGIIAFFGRSPELRSYLGLAVGMVGKLNMRLLFEEALTEV